MGISDGIEKFLHELIAEENGAIEIQRNTLANHFGCVPSQINYVIQTRFTTERGYIVESRRGGGGYIKIRKVSVPRSTYLMHVVNSIGDSINMDLVTAFVSNMIDYGQINAREGKLILSALSDKSLSVPQPAKDILRASILKNMIVGLSS